MSTSKYEHEPVLADLHWLPDDFTIAVLTFKLGLPKLTINLPINHKKFLTVNFIFDD